MHWYNKTPSTKIRTRKIRSLALALLVLVSYPNAAFSLSNQEIENKLGEFLNSRHPDQNESWFQALGSNAPEVMIKMYRASTNTLHRMRLVDGLRTFHNDSSVDDFFRKELATNSQSAERRGLVRNYATFAGEASVSTLESFLKDADPQMRMTAADSLKRLGSSAAQKILTKYKGEEKEKWIVQKLEEKLPQLKPLSIVSTSEDKKQNPFVGKWTGVWLNIKAEQLKSDVATLSFEAKGTNERIGKLEIKGVKNAIDVTLQLPKTDGSPANTGSGTLKEFGAANGSTFQIYLQSINGKSELRMHVNETGATFVGLNIGSGL